MSEDPGTVRLTRKPTDWTSILQLVLSALIALMLLGAGVAGLANSRAASGNIRLSAQLLSFSSLALALPPAISAVSSAFPVSRSTHARKGPSRWLTLFTGLVSAGLIALGWQLQQKAAPGWPAALLTVLGIVLPLLWLLQLGLGRRFGAAVKRQSGLMTFSIAFSLPLILIIELVGLIGLMSVVALLILGKPEISALLQNLAQNLETLAQNPDALMRQLEPLLREPAVIAGAFLLVSVLAPLVEETLKTLGVWLLAGRSLTPAEGYAAGLVSGAGFALAEGLGSTLQSVGLVSAGEWIAIILGRFQASLVHVFVGGLVGWALAKTWRDRKIWRALAVYALVMVLHGLWNGLTLTAIVLPYLRSGLSVEGTYQVIMTLFTAILLIGFVWFSRRVAAEAQPAQVGQNQADLQEA